MSELLSAEVRLGVCQPQSRLAITLEARFHNAQSRSPGPILPEGKLDSLTLTGARAHSFGLMDEVYDPYRAGAAAAQNRSTQPVSTTLLARRSLSCVQREWQRSTVWRSA